MCKIGRSMRGTARRMRRESGLNITATGLRPLMMVGTGVVMSAEICCPVATEVIRLRGGRKFSPVVCFACCHYDISKL